MRPEDTKLDFGMRGRFRAIVHDGKGNIKEETPFGKNRITLSGFNAWFTTAFGCNCVAGSGNAPPQESDSTLQSYRGKMAVWVSTSEVYNLLPAEGPIFHRSTRRFTFNPGAFGASAVNISEAGMALGANLSIVNGATPVGARGLLVDGSGQPTSVSVAPDEYLDIIWELTIYPEYEKTGSFVLVIDDVPTTYNYVMRPSNMGPSVTSTSSWKLPTTASLPQFFNPTPNTSGIMSRGGTAISVGELTDIGAGLPNVSLSHVEGARNSAAYVANSKQRSYEAVWQLTRGNIANGGGDLLYIDFGYASYQIKLDKKINKTAARQLNLPFMIALANVN